MTAPVDISKATLADIQRAIVYDLENNVERYRNDPLRFVLDWFIWEPGEGPDQWQRDFLTDLADKLNSRTFNGKDPVEAVRMAVASGHGIGKSAMVAFVFWWTIITRKNSKGTVTANTYGQLQTKTWPEIQKWHKRLRAFKDRFDVTDSKISEKKHRDSWFAVPVTCSEENSEAFAGQHNRESTSFYILDEASNVPDKIWEVAQQGLTDGEPFMFAFGNPTRNTGEFYEVCFGKQIHRWNQRSIDARTCKLPNKIEQQKWIEDHGLDSDFCRTRILGQPPAQSELQLISRTVVEGSQQRQMSALPGDPLIAGVDVPDGGSAWFAVQFRRGLDARPGPLVPPPFRVAGSKIDRETMIAHLAQMLSERDSRKRIDAMFIDKAYGSPIVERLRAMGYQNVFEIGFGDPAIDKRFANLRAYMWGGKMKDWLERGAIDPSDKRLAMELMAPGFHHKVGGDGALVLESKAEMQKRGIPSPDYADALALTFARPVAPSQQAQSQRPRPSGSSHSWMS